MRAPISMRTAIVSLALATQLVVGASGALQVLADETVPTGAYGAGPGVTGALDLPGASMCGQPDQGTSQDASIPQDCFSEDQ